jgi:CO dehydrogenase/acetyl-CoA synthase delta subunit
MMDTPQSCGCSCAPETAALPCGCTEGEKETFGETSGILTATSMITLANRFDHFLARWGVNRMGHTVTPGLYRLGSPDADSPIFASANYTLSFDALRSALAGIDAYILVLDTKGINVWCAAGKGTFGTAELVRSIKRSDLAHLVRHRTIILPQLGGPGISWPEVMRHSGFKVEYGPVRAGDLPQYLKTHTATPEMRSVRFPLVDRLVLVPVELVHAAPPAAAGALVLFFLAGPLAALAAITAVLAGTVAFPLLLPLLPTRDFSTKGLILGTIAALPVAEAFASDASGPVWMNAAGAGMALLIMPAVTAYLALNFTGCSTFTSRTGVKKEIFSYVPLMAVMAAAGVVLGILLGLLGWLEVI